MLGLSAVMDTSRSYRYKYSVYVLGLLAADTAGLYSLGTVGVRRSCQCRESKCV